MTQISQNVETDVLIKIKSKYLKKKKPITNRDVISLCINKDIESKGFFL